MTDSKSPPIWLRALGTSDLPAGVQIDARRLRLVRPFKHDFFAATGLYEDAAGRVVVKIYRTAPLLGLPMQWSGRLQSEHEYRMYELLAGIPGIPQFIGHYGPTGFAHEYIEG